MTKFYKNLLALFILHTCFLSCSSQSNFSERKPGELVTVTIDASQKGTTISPMLMGFNNVYCFEPDKYWQNGDGKIPQYLKALNTKTMRYPGGTVVTRLQWENPSGQGWAEAGEPEFDPAKNTSPSEFMSVDEYLAYTAKLGIEPLLGINMSTGIKYNKVDEYLERAIKLMKYCESKGVKVKYYYLDNEPYVKNISYKFTAKSYAEQVNIYADAMRKVDPSIKIIANTHPNNFDYTDTLLQIAGRNIDLYDVHYYWYHGRATFENWVSQPVMKRPPVGILSEQRNKIIELAKKYGRNDIDMVLLEWNVGPESDKDFRPEHKRTDAQIALMVSEMFADVLRSGMPMACFWPVSWPTKMDRALLASERGYEPNKVYDVFNMYKVALGQNLLSSKASEQRLANLSVKSKDGKTLWIFLVNKTSTKSELPVTVNVNGLRFSSVNAELFDVNDNNSQKLNTRKINAVQNKNNIKINMPQYSFAKLTINLK